MTDGTTIWLTLNGAVQVNNPFLNLNISTQFLSISNRKHFVLTYAFHSPVPVARLPDEQARRTRIF